MADNGTPPGGSGLPRQVLRTWHDPQPPQRDALTAERITAAGIQIADQHGISAVTIRRLSASMGYATMAVYRHISSRDELLLLMMDRALGPPPDLDPRQSWQAGLRRWAAGLFERYRAHPWLLDAPVPGMPVTPHHVMWVEHALAITSQVGLTTSQRLEAALLIDGHLRTSATPTSGASWKPASCKTTPAPASPSGWTSSSPAWPATQALRNDAVGACTLSLSGLISICPATAPQRS